MESAKEQQGRILLVDDESAILRTFRYCLEDEGYTVATANSKTAPRKRPKPTVRLLPPTPTLAIEAHAGLATLGSIDAEQTSALARDFDSRRDVPDRRSMPGRLS